MDEESESCELGNNSVLPVDGLDFVVDSVVPRPPPADARSWERWSVEAASGDLEEPDFPCLSASLDVLSLSVGSMTVPFGVAFLALSPAG